MTLAHFYASNYLRMATLPESIVGAPFMDRVNYLGTGSDESERMSVFAATIAQLTEDFGDWNMPWGQVNRLQRISGAIEQDFDDNKPFIPVGLASGDWGALASFRGARNARPGPIYGVYGNSFVAVVEFGDKVRAKSMLAGGQSNDPASPHFFDQGQRYADANFKDVAYYREDVDARMTRSYRPGE
jgi:acyl-homoserine lactone acylase PvdQ